VSAPTIRPLPGTVPRNGLPGLRPYTYRGAGVDLLTPELDDEPLPAYPPGKPRSQPCGTEAAYRRHERHGEQPCRECRECRDAHSRRLADTRARKRKASAS
jgi:hypothetical protein